MTAPPTQVAPGPTPSPDRRKLDGEHLNLLAIFHFVGAGLGIVGLLLLFGHYKMFSDVMSDPKIWEQSQSGPPPFDVLAVMKWIYLGLGAMVVLTGLLNLMVGLFLRGRKYRVFCLVIASMNCFYFPLGTALGIFTIVVLARDSVRQLYLERARQSAGA